MTKEFNLAQFKGEFQVDPVARFIGEDGGEYFGVVRDDSQNIYCWGVYGLRKDGEFVVSDHLCDCPTEEIAIAIKGALERVVV